EIAQAETRQELAVERIASHRPLVEKLMIPSDLTDALAQDARNPRIEGAVMTGVFGARNRRQPGGAERGVPIRRLVENLQRGAAGAEQPARSFERFAKPLLHEPAACRHALSTAADRSTDVRNNKASRYSPTVGQKKILPVQRRAGKNIRLVSGYGTV